MVKIDWSAYAFHDGTVTLTYSNRKMDRIKQMAHLMDELKDKWAEKDVEGWVQAAEIFEILISKQEFKLE